jgi:hypothetical protein
MIDTIVMIRDILSKIWHFHNNNISKKQGEYFKVWMNEFMFSNLNESYNKKEIGNIDSNVFYQVGNSLIHFSSIPNIPNISNVGIFISSDSKSEFCNRYPNETAGREIIVLPSKILLPIFLKASISTIEKMAEQDDKYKNTMLWIAGRLEKESGFIINPDFRDDILNFTNKHSNKTVEEK